jgi:hypothetical protein
VMEWSLVSGPTSPQALRSEAARIHTTNAMADALPLFEALACMEKNARTGSHTTRLHMPLSAQLALRLCLHPGEGTVPSSHTSGV